MSPTVSTHTVKGETRTTVIAHTTTIVSEPSTEVTKKTFKEYWFPFNTESENEDSLDELDDHDHPDPSLFKPNTVVRRAYDYWKSLTQDSEQVAKDLVNKARLARDEAAKEAKWAFLGYKNEARHSLESAEQKYRDALAAAEKVHEEALIKARSSWFHQAGVTQQESLGDQANDLTHEKWDQFKAAVDSFFFNPPKRTCSPNSQHWFSRQDPDADSGWDCREIWDRKSLDLNSIKSLPKKQLPTERVHNILAGLLDQANQKAKSFPSSTSFDSTLKTVKDYYQGILERVAKNEQGAVEELDTIREKIETGLYEAKYREEQVDAWLAAQWNSVIDNAGDYKDQYQRSFKNAIRSIKKSRAETYNSLSSNLHKSVDSARGNIKDAVKNIKNDIDKSKINKAIHDASDTFGGILKDAEAKIKAAPKNAYETAIEVFNKETDQLKTKLEQLAKTAKRSGSSLSYEASKTVSSVVSLASKDLNHAKKSVESMKSRASTDFVKATASVSSMWGAATPFTPLANAHDSYQNFLGNATTNLFNRDPNSAGDFSSIYGALTALYLLLLVRQIWLKRKCHAIEARHEHSCHSLGTKHKRRHSHSHSHHSNSSDDQHSDHHHRHHHHHHEKHEKHHKHSRQGQESNAIGKKRHHKDSFSAITDSYFSVTPMTMALFVFLELGGFSRVALHTLFVGLVTSQLLKCGCINGLLQRLGFIEGAHEGTKISQCTHEAGVRLGWAVFGLAGLANAIKVLHDNPNII
ncbi:hypothetical protein BGZ76_000251 [Entomortierella beljakovae]|nr:hypothetical protein BGZ76_000251 [Entomortierella beljakovae]